jgi:Asp-tRNA(Asn)/Glu-tRNA(Gln) amidotransferase A subunit family amidase
MGGRSSAIEEECQRRANRIRTDLQLRINDFRKHQQEEFSSIPSGKKQIVKEATAAELTQLMDSGKITSYEATLTFIERTATIGVRMNYVIEEMFEEAIARAKECDQIRKENPGKKCWRFGENKEDTLPPFFGVPISINDNILYPGKISYIGHVHPINPIPEQPSELILLIRKMGLIPFVKSSSPQSNKTL